MAKIEELKKGVRVSVAEEGIIYDGTVTKQVDDVCSVKFDNGEYGEYSGNELKGLTIIPEDTPEQEPEDENVVLTQTIPIPKSKVTITTGIVADPVKLAREEEKQAELAKRRTKNRIAKIKAKTLPRIKVRENLLRARLTKVRSGKSHTYRKEQVKAWAKELRLIIDTPKAWAPGRIRANKTKSAEEILDGLNLD